ncbi:CpaF family protein [Salinibacterium sp. SYSU T00001]|uniref:CpaF family protein n=1 Tax=Homoserinimonas sedimenticola TaxID=2986805 RepID=UPI002235EA42|nr:CpaF family protein [Salinibacterium sedimenticola]MCW4385428.1 CpaF family protein [Salinibacterium sedimenticola]
MSLADRLAAARAKETPAPQAEQPVARPAARAAASGALPPPREALGKLKGRATQALFVNLGSRMTDTTLSQEQLHDLVRRELADIVAAEELPLTSEERARLNQEVIDDVLGFGPLQRFLDDDAVTEIMVNGPNQIYVERLGRLDRSPVRFASEQHLRNIIERIVLRVGRRIDESSPLVDARLPDGSRVNAIIPPLAVDGSTLTIRKFSRDPFQVQDLIGFGTLTPQLATVLDAAVRARLNILVSGGTGTGKTTLLNVLSSFIPADERIVTIEDAVELQLQQPHVVRLESRPANIEGRGEITIRDLVRNSLRMRPDRIIVGEVRGGESLDMLQAMNTGHDGSISTLHANSPRDALSRLETMVLMAGLDLPLRAIRDQIASSVDVIVQISRLRDGSRRVTNLTEVMGIEGDRITLQDAFAFDRSAGVDAEGRVLGRIRPTGLRPRFEERFRELGIDVPPELFVAGGG